MRTTKTIALTGGGSGGHIFPLLSIANYLKDNNNEVLYKFIWVGEEESLEEEITRKYKIKFLPIAAGKIRRYFDMRNFYEPFKNLTGIVSGIFYILNHKIDIVFSKGGYVSIPLCIAAYILRKKIYIHESDLHGGLANKVITKLATKVFYTFPNEKIDNIKHIHSGQILNPEIIDYITDVQIESCFELQVFISGGSQGSTKIFEALLEVLPKLQDIKFQIVLGNKNGHFRDKFKAFPNTVVHDFLTQKRLGKILKPIDIAVTRGGATSLWELNVFGIHSIIVPLSHSAGNHQQKNAEYFHEKFGSDILNENSNLSNQILTKLQQYKQLRKAGLNFKHFFDALQIIEKEIQ